jgi:hypothetical protein
MGSKEMSKRTRQTHQFPQSERNAPEPPGGWPSAGSGYEPDPFSPAGSWAQAARFVDAVDRRVSRKVTVPLTIILIVLLLLGLFG